MRLAFQRLVTRAGDPACERAYRFGHPGQSGVALQRERCGLYGLCALDEGRRASDDANVEAERVRERLEVAPERGFFHLLERGRRHMKNLGHEDLDGVGSAAREGDR